LHADQDRDAHAPDVVGCEADVVVKRLRELFCFNCGRNGRLEGVR
jgi:hypothetical protein